MLVAIVHRKAGGADVQVVCRTEQVGVRSRVVAVDRKTAGIYGSDASKSALRSGSSRLQFAEGKTRVRGKAGYLRLRSQQDAPKQEGPTSGFPVVYTGFHAGQQGSNLGVQKWDIPVPSQNRRNPPR